MYQLKFLLFVVLALNLIAQEHYSMRLAYGKSSKSNLGDVLVGNIASDVANLRVLSLDGGYLIKNDIFDSPIDFYFKSSLSYFNEAGVHDDIYELTLYLKLYYKFSLSNTKMRFGFGEGGSYTNNILLTEYAGAQAAGDNTSKYLNYLDISLGVDLGSFFNSSIFKQAYMGLLIKHRSGIYGLINNVKHGGSNYNCIYIEKNF